MNKNRRKGKIGGTAQITRNPNRPTYDPAEHFHKSHSAIVAILSDETVAELNDWETKFMLSVMELDELSANQHAKVDAIYGKHLGKEAK